MDGISVGCWVVAGAAVKRWTADVGLCGEDADGRRISLRRAMEVRGRGDLSVSGGARLRPDGDGGRLACGGGCLCGRVQRREGTCRENERGDG